MYKTPLAFLILSISFLLLFFFERASNYTLYFACFMICLEYGVIGNFIINCFKKSFGKLNLYFFTICTFFNLSIFYACYESLCHGLLSTSFMGNISINVLRAMSICFLFLLASPLLEKPKRKFSNSFFCLITFFICVIISYFFSREQKFLLWENLDYIIFTAIFISAIISLIKVKFAGLLWLIIFLTSLFAFNKIAQKDEKLIPFEDEDGLLYPSENVALIQIGRNEFIKNACFYCHSLKPNEQDVKKGYSSRTYQNLDYIASSTLLANSKLKKSIDFADFAKRKMKDEVVFFQIYEPKIFNTNSKQKMPAYKNLFYEGSSFYFQSDKILTFRETSIRPKPQAIALVSFLQSQELKNKPKEEIVKTQSAGTSPTKTFLKKGQRVFKNQCQICHLKTGNGQKGLYPALKNSPWLKSDNTKRIIMLVLGGASGTFELDGNTYSGTMNSFKSLPNEDIAAVLTFIKNNFADTKTLVSKEEVEKVRLEFNKLNKGEKKWTRKELDSNYSK